MMLLADDGDGDDPPALLAPQSSFSLSSTEASHYKESTVREKERQRLTASLGTIIHTH